MTLFPAKFAPIPTDVAGLATIVDQLDDGKHLECDYPDASANQRDNNRRAGFAARGVLAYATRTFGGDVTKCSEDFTTVVGDLLADLMHLCDLLGLDFAELEEKGRSQYLPELAGRF
jgi:hypothetical protein